MQHLCQSCLQVVRLLCLDRDELGKVELKSIFKS